MHDKKLVHRDIKVLNFRKNQLFYNLFKIPSLARKSLIE